MPDLRASQWALNFRNIFFEIVHVLSGEVLDKVAPIVHVKEYCSWELLSHQGRHFRLLLGLYCDVFEDLWVSCLIKEPDVNGLLSVDRLTVLFEALFKCKFGNCPSGVSFCFIVEGVDSFSLQPNFGPLPDLEVLHFRILLTRLLHGLDEVMELSV